MTRSNIFVTRLRYAQSNRNRLLTGKSKRVIWKTPSRHVA